MSDVQEHVMTRTLKEIVIVPDHVNRTESAEFRKSKERLKADGHYRCWVCGSTENLQVHHVGLEWSLANVGDFDKLKEFVETFDVYGYGRLLKNQPITSVDDVRNCMTLCQEHHTGVDHESGGSGTGIHEITFPVWLIQKLAKQGVHAVPQAGETLRQAEATVKNEGD
ncbi:hypothetical protein LSG31_13025 [Fodinisporobacter ferrooxydans]|uniref:HNH endonuclease n=1 Tax=Fodinisporobacter ferrooxydans TaxID=2901836 RepID=A0ABY4CI94_9BACL|nr:hypothetical protein LSG31_13025 [Alicyclobacillaceae bacterium MYW30-H2]